MFVNKKINIDYVYYNGEMCGKKAGDMTKKISLKTTIIVISCIVLPAVFIASFMRGFIGISED